MKKANTKSSLEGMSARLKNIIKKRISEEEYVFFGIGDIVYAYYIQNLKVANKDKAEKLFGSYSFTSPLVVSDNIIGSEQDKFAKFLMANYNIKSLDTDQGQVGVKQGTSLVSEVTKDLIIYTRHDGNRIIMPGTRVSNRYTYYDNDYDPDYLYGLLKQFASILTTSEDMSYRIGNYTITIADNKPYDLIVWYQG